MENTGGEKDVGGGSAADSARERHVIRWENFLPRKSLRVLLVEHDDSTRHVVTALLRKCSYRVAGVADGTKAWEVMREKRYGFDLVLTEVETPTLSGIGLLSKIVSAEECKNIPVVMMSTHDSVNVVLKCMLKGAVDFLVKPVRKNELRNLWQHVWRRHSSDRYLNDSDNNTASNQISASAGGRSKTGEHSDESSAAQSSGSKPDREIQSTDRHGADLQAEEVHTSGVEDNQLNSDKDTTNQASEAKVDGGGDTREHKPVTVINVTLPSVESSLAITSQQQNCSRTISSDREENLNIERFAEGSQNCPKSYFQNTEPNESVQNMIVSVQPQLKRKHVLKHSVASAFSRYGDSKILSTFPKSVSSELCIRTEQIVDKCHTPVDGKNTPFSYTEHCLPCPQEKEGRATTVYLKVSTNNKEGLDLHSLPPKEIDHAGQASTIMDTGNHHPQFGFIPLTIPVGAIPYQSLCAGYGGILQPVFYAETSWTALPSVDRPTLEITSDHPVNLSNQPVNLSTLEQAYQSGSCSQGVPRGCGNNGSGETAGVVRNTLTVLESWNASEVQACNTRGIDCERAHREAALVKFRMKRKDRCFEKKVRYYNRKKLAEQRPRIKGQFVRQKILDSSTEAEN